VVWCVSGLASFSQFVYNFLSSVFTIEGDGKMTDIEKVDVLPLETMIIIRDRPFDF
jgi:hypothetical protein